MDINFTPEGEWKWTLTGFFIGYFIGSGITYSLLGGMLYGTIFGTIGGLLCFYDENFSGTF